MSAPPVPNNGVTPSEERKAYVGLAIKTIELATTREELLAWWKDERPNREKWKLSPYQWPGWDLDQAFRNKLKEYRNENL